MGGQTPRERVSREHGCTTMITCWNKNLRETVSLSRTLFSFLYCDGYQLKRLLGANP